MNTISYEIYRKGDMVPAVITDSTVYVERIKAYMGSKIEIRIVHHNQVNKGYRSSDRRAAYASNS